jgi:mono/diheme cytochrome c family protein
VKRYNRTRRRLVRIAGLGMLLIAVLAVFVACSTKVAALGPWRLLPKRAARCDNDGPLALEVGGIWYWQRSPDEEKRVVMGLFNRYCIRCHGVDGRGVWDIPGVPDFTNVGWQASRTDAQFATRILEGRGAVMPSFRGILSLEEAWAMARHLRSFVPGTEVSPPEFTPAKKLEIPQKQLDNPAKKFDDPQEKIGNPGKKLEIPQKKIEPKVK